MLRTGNEKMVVGYDLGDLYSQISYCFLNEEKKVETLSDSADMERYTIPTVLCKRIGVNQWFFGREALEFYNNHKEEGILVDHLVSLALLGEEILIDEETYHPVGLLTLFTKKCMNMLSRVAGIDKILALMITTQKLTADFVEVLGKVVRGISLKYARVYFQSHAESFYYFSLYQDSKFREYENDLFYLSEDRLIGMQLHYNFRTTPIVSYVEQQELSVSFPLEDEEFFRTTARFFGNRLISTVYLIGTEFSGDWMKQSLKYLCRGRRVFQGVNLFSKGACYTLLEKHYGSGQGKNYVFLGENKLKSNVGMNILRKGKESYLALMNAGENWYEEENTVEIYLEKDPFLDFVVTPLIGGKPSIMRMELPGLFPEEQMAIVEKAGGCGFRRVQVHLFMVREKCLKVEVTDLGFGEIYPASGKVWTDEMMV